MMILAPLPSPLVLWRWPGIKKYVERTGIVGENLVAIDSGANVNFDRLRHVAERGGTG